MTAQSEFYEMCNVENYCNVYYKGGYICSITISIYVLNDICTNIVCIDYNVQVLDNVNPIRLGLGLGCSDQPMLTSIDNCSELSS